MPTQYILRLRGIPAVVCVLSTVALAHEGFDVQIDRLTYRILHEPGNAELFFKRGELHRLHKNWDEALADFDQAEALDPSNDNIRLARSKVFLDSGNASDAVRILDEYCQANPFNGRAHAARARALKCVERFRESALAYATALDVLGYAGPDIYLEWARSVAAIGGEHVPQAIEVLNQAIARLGSVASLHRAAIDFELRAAQYENALARIDHLLDQSRRRDSWLALKGDVLVRAGRFDKAIMAYRHALNAIEILPAHLRGASATQERGHAVSRKLLELHSKSEAASFRVPSSSGTK